MSRKVTHYVIPSVFAVALHLVVIVSVILVAASR